MKKLFQKIFNLSDDGRNDVTKEKSSQKSRALSSDEETPEVEFAQNFTFSGGKFLFSEDVDDAVLNIRNIVLEIGLNRVFCLNSSLSSLLESIDSIQLVDHPSDADVFLTDCEYLVAYNGGVMIDAVQTNSIKLHELPDVFIVIAYSDQIVKRLNDALSGIRLRYAGSEMPSQITTLHGPLKSGLNDPVAQKNSKDIYLLYLDRG